MSIDRKLLNKSLLFLTIALLFAVFSLLGLCYKFPSWIASSVIIISDAYFLLVIFAAAILSDGLAKGHRFFMYVFPNRSIGLFICLLLWFSTILSFAALYLHGNMKGISDPFDAVYFSIMTLMTAGFGEITPTKDFQKLVMLEMITGFIFLIGTFPMILSRLTEFDEGHPKD